MRTFRNSKHPLEMISRKIRIAKNHFLGDSESAKSAILTHLEALNPDFYAFFALFED